MTSPAVGTPPSTPGNEGGEPQNPAPGAGNEQQPGSGAPPQSAGEPGNPSEPGKGGQEPAGGGAASNPPGNGDESKPSASQQPPANEPRRLTPEEWQAEQKRQQAEETRNAWATRAKEIVTKAPVEIRDKMDDLQEKLDTTIPKELRQDIYDWADDLIKHGTTGAELKYQEQYQDLKETLDDTSLAFLAACETPAERQKFADGVRGKSPDVWVKTILDLKTPAIAAKATEALVTAQAALLPEGEVRDSFTSKIKGESDPKKIAQAFHDTLVGVVGPGGEPRVAARGGGSGRPTLAEVTRRRAAGEYKSDADFLADQNLALQGT
jgi:hypothetical protein